jgi:hypothetical protein
MDEIKIIEKDESIKLVKDNSKKSHEWNGDTIVIRYKINRNGTYLT